jgi:hypothetical protein
VFVAGTARKRKKRNAKQEYYRARFKVYINLSHGGAEFGLKDAEPQQQPADDHEE